MEKKWNSPNNELIYKVENTRWNFYVGNPAHAVYGGRSTLIQYFFARVYQCTNHGVTLYWAVSRIP